MGNSPKSVNSLKELSRYMPDNDEIQAVIRDLTERHDRALAIVASSYTERWLEYFIANDFVELDKSLHKELFEGMGPLSSFSAKTKIAYAMGLYNNNVKSELDNLREIRNAFAHAIKAGLYPCNK